MSVNPPSARFEPGNPFAIGFQKDPEAEHIDRSSEALSDLAKEINRRSDSGAAQINICLSSVRFASGLPPQLYAFHAWDMDQDGQFVDPAKSGGEIRIAVIVNNPAEVQVETAISYLFAMVERSAVISQLQEQDDDLSNIDAEATAADDRAGQEFLARMRYGWKDAVAALALRAEEIGLKLSMRYQRDPFPNREEIVRRMESLRSAYNQFETVRKAIDNMVSMVGGSYPQMRLSGGGASNARALAQSHLAFLGLRQFQNQVTRDAEVCGNGYLSLADNSGPSPRCVPPELVEIDGDQFMEVGELGPRPLNNVLHLKGIDQIDSPYGLAMLEPVVYAVDTVRLYDETKKKAELALRESDNPGIIKWAEGSILLADRQLEEVEQKLSLLLGFHRDRLPPARGGLYFLGQEQMT